MKKSVLFTIIVLFIAPMFMFGQSYNSLWKEVENARDKDLPQTAISALDKVIAKASKEKNYGNLLKARLMRSGLATEVNPDSAEVEVEKFKKAAQEAEKSDPVLAAVYNCVLGNYYKRAYAYNGDRREKAQEYYAKALASPALLARHKAEEMIPFTEVEADSKYFNHDLLSVIGFEAGDMKTLHDYYEGSGNREATFITALEMIIHKYTDSERYDIDEPAGREVYGYDKSAALDSLILLYGDLDICGAAAVSRAEEGFDDIKSQYSFLNNAISRWSRWKGINELRNMLSSITAPRYYMKTSKGNEYPGKPFDVALEMRNLKGLTVRFYRMDISPEEYHKAKVSSTAADILDNYGKTLAFEKTMTFAEMPPYMEFKDTMKVPGLPMGIYVAEAVAPEKGMDRACEVFHVTRLTYLTLGLPGNKIRFAALDRESGQPVPNAKIGISKQYSSNEPLVFDYYTTDAKGELVLPNIPYPSLVVMSTDDDNAFLVSRLNYGGFSYSGLPGHKTCMTIYTDRSVYRPGQTVKVAALAYAVWEGTETKALEGEKFVLELLNANREVVGEKELSTDEFGMASADFVLPTSGLTGHFYVRAKKFNSGRDIKVEEYKRPTFEVEFDNYEQSYKVGDKIMVKGRAKSYAGVPVQGAKVAYTVKRRQAWWCWWRHYENEEVELSRGEVMADDRGEFEIPLAFIYPTGSSAVYNYTVSADVTDAAGESHGGEMTLPLGTKEYYFNFNLPKKELKEKLNNVTFSLRNAAGNPVEADVTYTIDGKNEKTVKANETVTLDLTSLSSGQHVMEAVCKGDTVRNEFVIFSLGDKVPYSRTHDWFYATDDTFPRDGKPVSVMVGSSDESVHVLYTIISGDKVLESGVMALSNSIDTRKFGYKETYGSGILLNYAWVKNGETYMHTCLIRKPLPVKDLNVKWTTFRDRLTPGQKEEWTLNVQTPDGKPARAHLLATMYDKSLDQIVPYSMNLSLPLSQSLPYVQWRLPYKYMLSVSDEMQYDQLEYKDFLFSTFAELEFGGIIESPVFVEMNSLGGRRERMLMAKADAYEVSEEMKIYDIAVPAEDSGEAVSEQKSEPNEDNNVKETVDNTVSVRENFNETAFFLPTLLTDSKGNVSLKFTLPESVTTWQVRGMAHDTDMNYGIFSASAVARKNVMVQPNIPRFVRMGDKATVSTRIFNTSEKNVSGKVKMQLIDPETETVVAESMQQFTVEAGKTGSATFTFDPENTLKGKDLSLLICRITASGTDFSDGEQHYLPILPSKEMLINTLPITQHGPGKLDIDLSGMIPSGKDVSNRNFTLEYTNNPAWLMVQAIPFVGDVNEKNAISLAAAYYANSLGLSIVNSAPKIASVFKEWQQETGNEKSLASQLEKNQELKSLVLDETPWVADAKDEADRRRQIARFFDDNEMKQRLENAVDRLKVLQNSDGSFSWWQGMPGSPYITAEVVELLTRLNVLAGKQRNTADILTLANDYLSKIVIEEVEEIKRREKKGQSVSIHDYNALQWVYMNVISGSNLTPEEIEAKNYLIKYLDKKKLSESIYAKALMSVIFAKEGQTEKAAGYIRSLKEYTVYNAEKGRYYETPRAGYSWFDYRIPTQTAVIEALQMVTPEDKQTIEEMRRWLLTEKRTQAWDTYINSVNAVFAFLYGNEKVIDGQEMTTFSVDNHKINTPKGTAGLGYVKTAIDAENPKQLEVTKTSEGTSWGAVYARFMQPVKDVADTSSGLTVKRELISVSAEKPLDSMQALKVGDKVRVRITIKADRDYDFVQLIDKRAACLEPINQLSGYHWGYYIAPKDYTTNYYFDRMAKGTYVVEAEYYVDRAGEYTTGTCTVQCAYAPEFSGRSKALTITVK
ncbi:MAG: alpha-2-macroglobulin family protein [Prevotella sp.]|uniref:alpha-2-macroglobulin family protein n=1 Tax=Prevotella sp. TaxID=59823 RepID=UPI002A25BFE0|nr:alpha-2-macroglobulin family protein [Prevotella sp.]MDD7319089.1 alpha-2-macroglobulin family protein [Prevotellaceae bacterium]MDY4019636.1 alpha-2-macroglobulin family protein [Prevotella sp.]